jgi:hypothetical protein
MTNILGSNLFEKLRGMKAVDWNYVMAYDGLSLRVMDKLLNLDWNFVL